MLRVWEADLTAFQDRKGCIINKRATHTTEHADSCQCILTAYFFNLVLQCSQCPCFIFFDYCQLQRFEVGPLEIRIVLQLENVIADQEQVTVRLAMWAKQQMQLGQYYMLSSCIL